MHGGSPSPAPFAGGSFAIRGSIEQWRRDVRHGKLRGSPDCGFQCPRQCDQILRRQRGCAGSPGYSRRKARCSQRAGPRRRHSSGRFEKHLQALLPREPPLADSYEGNRTRTLHREGDSAEAWRQGIRRKRGRRRRDYRHDGTAEGQHVSRILVVEDEAHLAKGLCFNLQAEGYSAEVVGDGETATDRLLGKKENFDAIVLDIMLPGKDGFSVVSELRAARNYVPVLMLTARSRPEDVLKGFAAGADDYLPKPFDLSILLARLQGLLRRSQWMRSGQSEGGAPDSSQLTSDRDGVGDFGTFSFDGKTIDFGTLELRTADNVIHLTLMESELLRHLVRNDGRVVSRKQILEEVWGLHDDTDTRAIDNFMVRLRRYIEDDPVQPRHLLTVRGVGYRFLANPEKK